MTTIEQAKKVEQRLRKCAVTEISPWEAADTISSMITELEAAQKDAARYRTVLGMTHDQMLQLHYTRSDFREQFVDAAIAAGVTK